MSDMRGFVWGLAAGVAMLFLLLATALTAGRLPRLNRYPLAVHVGSAALVWLIGIGIDHGNAPAPLAAYLVTLAAIWNYRHKLQKRPSGWYRLGAAFSLAWCLLWASLLAVFRRAPIGGPGLLYAWLIAVLGLAPWLVGWLVQWRQSPPRVPSSVAHT